MKIFLLLCSFLAAMLSGCAPSVKPASTAWQASYATLLTRYVQPNGVRYAAWKASPADVAMLQQVTTTIGESAAPGDPKASLAYYLDAYNAWMLRLMLAEYPTLGPLARDPDFFKMERIRVAGKKLSLDLLENEIIRAQYHEPRVHFALNCASKSCPPLRATPYSTGDLEAALQAQATAYLNDPNAVTEAAGKLVLSQIFEWFADDFTKAAGTVPKFIAPFRTIPLTATEVTYREYDWSLNEAPTPHEPNTAS